MKTEKEKRLLTQIAEIFNKYTTVLEDVDYGGGSQKLTFLGSPHYSRAIDQIMLVVKIADLPEKQASAVLILQDLDYKFVSIQDDGSVLFIQTDAGINTPQEILVHADGTTSKKSN